MIRIIAGKFRSRLIETPLIRSTKPTKDNVREAIFSSIGPEIQSAQVLDLFSGSGAYGLESLSRGAKRATMVEKHPAAYKVIQRNIQTFKLSDTEARLVFGDYKKALQQFAEEGQTFDIVFLDPPYGKGYEMIAFKLLNDLKLLNARAIIVIESDQISTVVDSSYAKVKDYAYGNTFVRILWRNL